jgi:hypothetical protein
MAIQPIKFLVSPSATAINASKTITVSGNVDCSYIYSGTAVFIGNSQVVEAISGSPPDTNGNSLITLRYPWPFPDTTDRLVAINTIEGMSESIRYAREVVSKTDAISADADRAAANADRSLDSVNKAALYADLAMQTAGIYKTVQEGLAAVQHDKYFQVPSSESTEFVILYKNESGVAVEVKRYPSKLAIENLGLEDQNHEVSGLIFAVTDDNGKLTWLEVLKDGGPSARAVKLIQDRLSVPDLVNALPDFQETEEIPFPDTNEQIFALVDETGRRTWLEVIKDGGPSARAVKLIQDRLSVPDLVNALPDFQETEEIPFPDTNEQIFALVDETGRRTWLEVIKDGGPSARAVKLIQDKLSVPDLVNVLPDFQELEEIARQDLNEPHFAITDEENRRTWLEMNQEGKPTARAIALIAEKLVLAGDFNGTAQKYSATVNSKKLGVVSGPNIVCWGDSMTAGAGGNGTTYPLVLQQLLQQSGSTAVVTNRGVGGESSVTITCRTNANPFLVTVSGGVIPATGQVAISLLPVNGHTPGPMKQGPASYKCSLLGVKGTFGRTVVDNIYNYWFQRDLAGVDIPANRPSPLYLDTAEEHRGDIAIIWIGQNGPSNERAIQDAKAIVRNLTALEKRFLVISKPGGTTAQNTEDARWFEEFGRRFIPIRQYMVEFGLSDAGITPTEQDLTDIASGTVPASLRVDSVHWVASGYQILGRLVFERLNELGWL